jgi:hypothetical protein
MGQLFMSEASQFAVGKPIRGGVPISLHPSPLAVHGVEWKACLQDQIAGNRISDSCKSASHKFLSSSIINVWRNSIFITLLFGSCDWIRFSQIAMLAHHQLSAWTPKFHPMLLLAYAL